MLDYDSMGSSLQLFGARFVLSPGFLRLEACDCECRWAATRCSHWHDLDPVQDRGQGQGSHEVGKIANIPQNRSPPLFDRSGDDCQTLLGLFLNCISVCTVGRMARCSGTNGKNQNLVKITSQCLLLLRISVRDAILS